MWLSWKSLGHLATLYTLITRAKNKIATGEVEKLFLEDRKEHRGYNVTRIIARGEYMHEQIINIKLAQDEKSAPGATEEGIASASRARRE